MNNKHASRLESLMSELERELMYRYGSPLLTGKKLAEAMGYPSIHALRKHMSQSTFPVTLFTIPGRRGRFVLVKDIAFWLAKQRIDHQCHVEEERLNER